MSSSPFYLGWLDGGFTERESLQLGPLPFIWDGEFMEKNPYKLGPPLFYWGRLDTTSESMEKNPYKLGPPLCYTLI